MPYPYSMKSACPHIPSDLMNFIDSTYPERCPDKEDSERAIWMYAGKRELVRWLMLTKKIQEENLHDRVLQKC